MDGLFMLEVTREMRSADAILAHHIIGITL
jgi:hypothetical protein